MKSIIFLCCFFLISSKCRYANSSIVQDQDTIVINTADCFDDRKNEKELDLLKASIVNIGSEFYIDDTEGNQRYFACNLPDTCKKEGLIVTCSLIVKEIFPYERRMATPGLLTKVALP